MRYVSETPGTFSTPGGGLPAMPRVDTPRDMDAVLAKGSVLALGNQPYQGDFFVAPIGKVRRGGTRGGTNYKWTREGWALAWAEFEAGDPAAAAEYRLLADRRQEAIARDDLRRAKAEVPMIAMLALRDTSFAVVPKCGWINGYGFGGLSEHEVTIFFLLDSIEIVPTTSNQPILSLQLTDLLMIHVDGPGLVTTGGGFIGGGEGLTGAIEGMAIARVLNALTRRSTVQTFIELHALGKHALWITDQVTPRQLGLLLRPVQARLREARIMHDEVALDPLDRLAKLSALKSSGVLTEDEYASAKSTILGDLV